MYGYNPMYRYTWRRPRVSRLAIEARIVNRLLVRGLLEVRGENDMT